MELLGLLPPDLYISTRALLLQDGKQRLLVVDIGVVDAAEVVNLPCLGELSRRHY